MRNGGQVVDQEQQRYFLSITHSLSLTHTHTLPHTHTYPLSLTHTLSLSHTNTHPLSHTSSPLQVVDQEQQRYFLLKTHNLFARKRGTS